ncbi:non-hydrolyzing UDP-N-acetylglucosamine 2-epimerase [Pontibacter akesuensis]|uniref:UDP-N-acetylglucosamine 2-epimerase (non-hydrolyzing) n=1 Tax=Pontibacter akesuensis TaxID=388950 RepID=A0A1I7GBG1_9BACT|nr:UDP-N-acetylglucosamine 2-epimerase (non-hydrolyzing) [Pontibacter akesuensis]GHA57655.1 UDP-N-acetyl glucosamine 2-epimerase [Pontibacter akesuensis]SFU45792.1 UDP-N-Acetylglucosamine 2-epimerase [Pontibacter akesuensis]
MKSLFIFGTRPEAIKLAPLIKEFEATPDFDLEVCITAQHREMLDQVLDFFKIKPDYDLNLMKPNQNLFAITADALTGLKEVIEESKPDLIIVQGDTTTAFAGALAGFYKQIKIAHVEAGLRSNNLYSPFPEEANRLMIGQLADYHFAPTQKAFENLQSVNKQNVWDVGNTVIDALLLGLELIEDNDSSILSSFEGIDFSKRIILVTAHRRESFGEPFENICNAIRDIAEEFEACEIVFPVHLNPNVRQVVSKILSDIKNVHLIEPLDYPKFIWLINKSFLIITDSGGVQEEAPTLGKPVLVIRDETEREEGITAGTAKLVATNRESIYSSAYRLLTNEHEYNKMANAVNPYGDGTTSKQIVKILKEVYC